MLDSWHRNQNMTVSGRKFMLVDINKNDWEETNSRPSTTGTIAEKISRYRIKFQNFNCIEVIRLTLLAEIALRRLKTVSISVLMGPDESAITRGNHQPNRTYVNRKQMRIAGAVSQFSK